MGVGNPGRETGRPQPIVITIAARPSSAASRVRRRSCRQPSGDNTNATAPIGKAPARTSPSTSAKSWPPGLAGGVAVVEARQTAGLGDAGGVGLGLGGGGGGGATDGVGRGAAEAGGGGAVDGVGRGEGLGDGDGGGGGGATIVYGAAGEVPFGSAAPAAVRTVTKML